MTRTVTGRQLALLRRIVGDGPAPRSDEASTVYALRTRGLVTTTSQYGYRSPSPTAAGRVMAAIATPASASSGGAPDVASAADVGRPVGIPSDAGALINLLTSSGTPVVAPSPTKGDRAEWRRLVFAAQSSPLIPAGMVLRHRGRDSGDFVVWLEPSVSEVPADVSAMVPVPERLYRPHPLVGVVRNVKASGDGWIDTRRRRGCAHVRVSAASRLRTMRILQALVTEALRRGYAIRTAESHGCAGGLGIGIGEYTWELTISEASNRVAHELSADDKRRIERG